MEGAIDRSTYDEGHVYLFGVVNSTGCAIRTKRSHYWTTDAGAKSWFAGEIGINGRVRHDMDTERSPLV